MGMANHDRPMIVHPCCTSVGPMYGPFRLRDGPETIEVLDGHSGEVIGVATRLEHAPAGIPMWRLAVRDVQIDDRWHVFYREFCRYGDTV
jgi:hypothetical protein